MPPVFEITTSTNSVRLDDERRGKALFTVYNASGRLVEGRAYVETDKPVAKDWLSIAGTTEREFKIAESKDYTVQIAVPPDGPPDSYSFQLNMEEVKAEGRTVVEGPWVTFSVPEPPPPPPPPPPPRFPWWIVAVAAGALIVSGVLIWLSLPLRGVGPGWALQSNRQGGTDAVTAENPAGFGVGDSLSIELWVKPSSLSLGNIQALVVGGRGSPFTIYVLFWQEIENPVWGFVALGAVPGGPIRVESTASGGPKAGEWQHLAATYDGATVDLYRNGKRVETEVVAVSASVEETLQSLGIPDEQILALATGLDVLSLQFPDGTMDEVRLWNGVRTRGQIRADKSRILEGDEPGLFAYYKLDEDRVQSAIDSTAYGNNGRLGDSPAPDARDPTWVESSAPLWKRPFRLWTLLLAVGVLVLAGGGVAAYFLWLRPAGILESRR